MQRLTDRILYPRNGSGPKTILAHLPLLMVNSAGIYNFVKLNFLRLLKISISQVCLDGLGNLSENHTVLASSAISCLRDFLVNPSDLLKELNSSGRAISNKPGITLTGTFFS